MSVYFLVLGCCVRSRMAPPQENTNKIHKSWCFSLVAFFWLVFLLLSMWLLVFAVVCVWCIYYYCCCSFLSSSMSFSCFAFSFSLLLWKKRTSWNIPFSKTDRFHVLGVLVLFSFFVFWLFETTVSVELLLQGPERSSWCFQRSSSILCQS